jgi:hypothetical protein
MSAFRVRDGQRFSVCPVRSRALVILHAHLPSPIFQNLAQLMRTFLCKFAVRAPVACSAKKKKEDPMSSPFDTRRYRRAQLFAVAASKSARNLRPWPAQDSAAPPQSKSRASPARTKNRKFQAAPLPSPSRRAFSRVFKGLQELIF